MVALSNSTTSFSDVFPSVSHAISIKLDSSNNSLWLAQLLPVLYSRQLLAFVDGTSICPSQFLSDNTGKASTKPNPAYAKWVQNDQLVLSWINGFLGHQALTTTAHHSTAHQLALADTLVSVDDMVPVVMSNVGPKFENSALFLVAELLLADPPIAPNSSVSVLVASHDPLPLVAAHFLIVVAIVALAVSPVGVVIIGMMGLATIVVMTIVAIVVLVVSAIVVVVVLSKMDLDFVDPTMLLGFFAQPHLMVPPDLAARFAILLAMDMETGTILFSGKSSNGFYPFSSSSPSAYGCVAFLGVRAATQSATPSPMSAAASTAQSDAPPEAPSDATILAVPSNSHVYVDDILVTGNNPSHIDTLIKNLGLRFSMKNLGPVHYFFIMEVVRTSSGLFLSQHKYTTDLLHRTKMHGAKPVPTPAVNGRRLSLQDGDPLPDPTEYRSVVGALQYLTLTLCQFLHQPTSTHWAAVKRILHYLVGTPTQGLTYKPGSFRLTAFSDADYAGDPDDGRSTGGYFLYLGSNLVSWSAKKQTGVSRSSTEADAISIASNPMFHAHTQHVEVDYHYVREKVVRKEIDVRYLSTHEQIADIFTKGLSHPCFRLLVSKLPSLNSKGTKSAVTTNTSRSTRSTHSSEENVTVPENNGKEEKSGGSRKEIAVSPSADKDNNVPGEESNKKHMSGAVTRSGNP
ncbi:hypothetical protein D8674_008209 [Pyrus ussuriensis x Pyrus communis]|uniref:Reverse transcriptase Ty1/copia-type domain-containing protein n=1 Tax=Pyrus ussuriensis x Pyrus communis TaxID=2448454 RepID=A0A5N5HZ15_9ROSA|nr:hypothetical protein D8674_008209 [Pyrus ussuriensis x Pyrus communis]